MKTLTITAIAITVLLTVLIGCTDNPASNTGLKKTDEGYPLTDLDGYVMEYDPISGTYIGPVGGATIYVRIQDLLYGWTTSYPSGYYYVMINQPNGVFTVDCIHPDYYPTTVGLYLPGHHNFRMIRK